MAENYMSNVPGDLDPTTDDAQMELLMQLQEENEKFKDEIKEKDKTIKTLESKIETLEIDLKKEEEINESQEKLLNFYKENPDIKNDDHNSDKQLKELEEKNKDLEIKIMNYEEKIMDFEDKVDDQNKQIEKLTLEKKESKATYDNMLSMLTDKEVEIKKLENEIQTYLKKYNSETIKQNN
jgi:chromosome segregation ATPase